MSTPKSTTKSKDSPSTSSHAHLHSGCYLQLSWFWCLWLGLHIAGYSDYTRQTTTRYGCAYSQCLCSMATSISTCTVHSDLPPTKISSPPPWWHQQGDSRLKWPEQRNLKKYYRPQLPPDWRIRRLLVRVNLNGLNHYYRSGSPFVRWRLLKAHNET
jgi:hypothetical protein